MCTSTSTVQAWQALASTSGGATDRALTSRPGSISAGSAPGFRYAASASCPSDRRASGSPRTWAPPPDSSRSLAEASSTCPATSSSLSRIRSATSWAAPAAITALLLPPVPGPQGATAVSPWMKAIEAGSQPSTSATIWAIVVSTLCPWLAVPMISVISPLGSIRRMAPSLPSAPRVWMGSTYRLSPMPR